MESSCAQALLTRIFHVFPRVGWNSIFRGDEVIAQATKIRASICWFFCLAQGATASSPAWMAGHLGVNAQARHLSGVQGERSWFTACAKMSALGQLEAKYRRMRRVLRVSTAASLRRLMRRCRLGLWPQPFPVTPAHAAARSARSQRLPARHAADWRPSAHNP